MVGLAYAMRRLPVGTAYAVWVGIGAALTVAFGMATGDETVSAVKIFSSPASSAASRPQARAL